MVKIVFLKAIIVFIVIIIFINSQNVINDGRVRAFTRQCSTSQIGFTSGGIGGSEADTENLSFKSIPRPILNIVTSSAKDKNVRATNFFIIFDKLQEYDPTNGDYSVSNAYSDNIVLLNSTQAIIHNCNAPTVVGDAKLFQFSVAAQYLNLSCRTSDRTINMTHYNTHPNGIKCDVTISNFIYKHSGQVAIRLMLLILDTSVRFRLGETLQDFKVAQKGYSFGLKQGSCTWSKIALNNTETITVNNGDLEDAKINIPTEVSQLYPGGVFLAKHMWFSFKKNNAQNIFWDPSFESYDSGIGIADSSNSLKYSMILIVLIMLKLII